MTAEGTVPTVGTRAYIDTELSFEKDPAELGDQALWMLIHTKQAVVRENDLRNVHGRSGQDGPGGPC